MNAHEAKKRTAAVNNKRIKDSFDTLELRKDVIVATEAAIEEAIGYGNYTCHATLNDKEIKYFEM